MIVMYLEFSQRVTVKEISDYLRLHQPQFCEQCKEMDGNDTLTRDGQSGKNRASKCGICKTVSFLNIFLIDMVIYCVSEALTTSEV